MGFGHARRIFDRLGIRGGGGREILLALPNQPGLEQRAGPGQLRTAWRGRPCRPPSAPGRRGRTTAAGRRLPAHARPPDHASRHFTSRARREAEAMCDARCAMCDVRCAMRDVRVRGVRRVVSFLPGRGGAFHPSTSCSYRSENSRTFGGADMGDIKTFRDLHAWQVGMDTMVLTVRTDGGLSLQTNVSAWSRRCDVRQSRFPRTSRKARR